MPTVSLADTVTMLDASHRGRVLVTGSHGGLIAAYLVARGGVRAAIFNDAGGGLGDAGFAGLAWLEALGMAAATVAHSSARIADAVDSYAWGVISHANVIAARLGVGPGMRCSDAADALCAAPAAPSAVDVAPPNAEARTILCRADGKRPEVRGLDSIGLLLPEDAGAVLVIGSHGALHGGRAESALPVDAAAAIFHDAGRGKDDAGITRLPVLAGRGIPAATVDFRTARIGDARSLWATGVLSAVNDAAAGLGWRVGDTVRRVITRIEGRPHSGNAGA